MRKRMGEALFWIVTLYLAFVVVLYLMQRDMMYFPEKEKPDVAQSGVEGMQEITVKTQDGLSITGWFKSPKESQKPVILWFHGNGLGHADRIPRIIPYIEEGYGVLLAGYRGYSGNPGKPTEGGLYDDARAYISALKDKEYKVVLYGESLGTGVVTKMALEYLDIPAVILEAPYTSAVDIARMRFPIIPAGLLMKDQYQSIERVPELKRPLLSLHGQKDRIIPYRFGRKLYDAASEPKIFKSFPDSDHINLYEFGASEAVLEFLSAL